MRTLSFILGMFAIVVSTNTAFAEPKSDSECWPEARRVAGEDKDSIAYREAFNACILGLEAEGREVVVTEETAEPPIALSTNPPLGSSSGEWVRISPNVWVRQN